MYLVGLIASPCTIGTASSRGATLHETMLRIHGPAITCDHGSRWVSTLKHSETRRSTMLAVLTSRTSALQIAAVDEYSRPAIIAIRSVRGRGARGRSHH